MGPYNFVFRKESKEDTTVLDKKVVHGIESL